MDQKIMIGGREVAITNPDKYMWPKYKVRKIDFIKYLLDVSSYILPYIRNRLITTIRFPDGVCGKSFYQKNKPDYAPDWLPSYRYAETEYMIINDPASLIYLGNQACLEIHTSFHRIPGEEPAELVFDLDPSIHDFSMVIEAALCIKEELDQLQITSLIKTSGATGLQIYVPLKRGHTFEETRKFGSFFGKYLSEKYPRLFTIERMVKKRGRLIYFDYLQHWRGKTLIAPYSTRAREIPMISTPIKWSELPFVRPEQFTIFTIIERIKKEGDLFTPLLQESQFDLKSIIRHIS